MAFIKTGTTKPPQPAIQPPPMPALQSIFYCLAFMALFGAVFAFKIESRFEIAIIGAAGVIFISLILFGIGQAIGYLGQTAYYTQKIAEMIKENERP